LRPQSIKNESIILGIDPGTSVMGFGVIACKGNSIKLLEMNSINFDSKKDHFVRIKQIFDRTLEIIDHFKPDELAIESPFFGKNIQSMLKLGRAQGAAITAALSRSIPIYEYAPRKIKSAITGQGNASKEKVANYLVSMLKISVMPESLDATDGLAAAVCHYYQKSNPIAKSGSIKNWNDYIKKNPGKVK
jgi:crossover junction endodeoxyribonuclease RuvC